MSQQATFWAVTTEISGRHLGSIFGLMNSLGVPGAVCLDAVPGAVRHWMREQGHEGRAQWDPAFYVYAWSWWWARAAGWQSMRGGMCQTVMRRPRPLKYLLA